MSREIKFKAWDKKRKLFVPISKLCTTTDNCRVNQILQTWSGKALSEHEYDLVQYTGLKDKNGKEIYEDEILKLPRGKAHPILEIFKVVFLEGSYGLLDKDNIHYRWLDLDTANESEAIGNIHTDNNLLHGTN